MPASNSSLRTFKSRAVGSLRHSCRMNRNTKQLTLKAEQFFAPIRDVVGLPPSIEVAMLHIDDAAKSSKGLLEAAKRKQRTLNLLRPLTKAKISALEITMQNLASKVATLESCVSSLSSIRDTLLRRAELYERRLRSAQIERRTQKLQEELASAERAPEVKMQKLRSRVSLSDRENRETVERFRSEIPRTEGCPYCGQVIREFHLDHIVPVSYGGRPRRENLVWVCAVCNLKKRDLTLFEFVEKFNLEYLTVVARLRSLGKRV